MNMNAASYACNVCMRSHPQGACAAFEPPTLELCECSTCGGRNGHFSTCTVGYDPVNHPSHYVSGGIETIDFIEAKELNYHLGNVVKYVSRAGRKGDAVEDLKKARWYLDRAIEKTSPQGKR